MKPAFIRPVFSRSTSELLFAAVLAVAFSPPLIAQSPAPNTLAEQRAAMQKLSFLSGRWSGPATVSMGPDRTFHLVQTESVQYKLDGLVLLIQGASTTPGGKIEFSALATIAYDDASCAYRIRAYNDGHYVDTELSVVPNGFSWGFAAGPAHVVNTMHLTPAGEWHEVAQTSFAGGASHTSVEMTLRRVK